MKILLAEGYLIKIDVTAKSLSHFAKFSLMADFVFFFFLLKSDFDCTTSTKFNSNIWMWTSKMSYISWSNVSVYILSIYLALKMNNRKFRICVNCVSEKLHGDKNICNFAIIITLRAYKW